jgi:hypothetical protein
MDRSGRKRWVIPGGNIPLKSTGREPELVSQDRIAILNTGHGPVSLHLTLFLADHSPVVGYKITVDGQRLKKVRINDLIDPFPVTLETGYGLLIDAEEPVIVQFLRMNTGNENNAGMGTMCFGTDT